MGDYGQLARVRGVGHGGRGGQGASGQFGAAQCAVVYDGLQMVGPSASLAGCSMVSNELSPNSASPGADSSWRGWPSGVVVSVPALRKSTTSSRVAPRRGIQPAALAGIRCSLTAHRDGRPVANPWSVSPAHCARAHAPAHRARVLRHAPNRPLNVLRRRRTIRRRDGR